MLKWFLLLFLGYVVCFELFYVIKLLGLVSLSMYYEVFWRWEYWIIVCVIEIMVVGVFVGGYNIRWCVWRNLLNI